MDKELMQKAREIVYQIMRSTYTDKEGHNLKNNKDYIDLKEYVAKKEKEQNLREISIDIKVDADKLIDDINKKVPEIVKQEISKLIKEGSYIEHQR